MDSIDLLDKLKLNDYYPQKLSFSEAIKLRGNSQNGCQEQYGLEIVRKLLMFDSTAVVSVTTEINNSLSNTGNKETENKVQCVSEAVRPPQKINVRPSFGSNTIGQSERKLHPMDLLVVALYCCDDFLRQVLVEKMVVNKLSIPILLPSVKNGSYTFLLLALRSLVPEVQDRTRESSSSLTDTLVDVKNPVVSFIRVGDLHRSKSKLVNELLSFNSFSTFFHRECSNGSAKRSISNGSIEAAWFQSENATEPEFNCRFFTVLNLRGNARDYPKQTQFLCQSSTLVVFMVDSFEPFKKLYENVLKEVDVSQTKIIVCYISSVSPNNVDSKYFKFLECLGDRGVISEVKYDWNKGGIMSDVDFANDLKKTIPKFLKRDRMSTYANIIQRGQKFGFSLDEDKPEYESAKSSSETFVGLVLNLLPDCKPKILPLQAEPWVKIGILEREQRRKPQDNHQDEHFIAEKETEKRRQRQIQCRRLIQQNEIILKFALQFHSLQDQNLLYFLDSCKIKLDARSRVVISNIVEECKKEQEHHKNLSHGKESEVELSKMQVKIANSAIGLEHILLEHGQVYEAVISEEIRMKEDLKDARFKPDVIRNFPSIVARLLLMGQPLELMDGDTSNVPITWLKAVLDQVRIMTNHAEIFVMSIIGVQSSGKSSLLNALFGLQFPVSAGRCTKGIYCHLVPVDKECLNVEYDYVLVVDTEGLGASQFTETSTFRDNELATFAIGLADATIINMKGENWAEMKDILQIVAYGLIRIRRTKAELELMPRCMFVHQNVPAADAKEKNWLGQEKQLSFLDKAIKEAGSKEGFKEITKFDQVIKYDRGSHSWYFPDLWNGRPPKARISHDYIEKTNELRQYLMELMIHSPSKLTISRFFLRMSDLWNAMLHNDFVLCFRNTHEIVSVTILNDRISNEEDTFKYLNKRELTRICESVRSNESIETLRAKRENILREVSDAVERHFTDMKATLQGVIDATDICAALKQEYEKSFIAIKMAEFHRVENETRKVISVHMKKLEYANDKRVKNLNSELAELEKCIEELKKDKLKEPGMNDFEKKWQGLIDKHKVLVDERMNLVESKIEGRIRRSITELNSKAEKQLDIVEGVELFKPPLVFAMPQVTESDLVQKHKLQIPTRWVMDLVYSKSDYVHKANSNLYEALEKWKLQFQNQRGLEFDASHLEKVMLEVGQLLGIPKKEKNATPGPDEKCSILPPGYSLKRDYITGFIKFAYHYIYDRSLENGKRFISVADPQDDIDERRQRSLSYLGQITAEANIDAVSQQIFDFAERSFVSKLGELIKTEVCKEDNNNPTFKSKRAFLRPILAGLGKKANSLTNEKEEAKTEKQKIFKQFMLYVDLAESKASKDFFQEAILKLLKEMLVKESGSQTDFQKMIENNFRTVLEDAKNALRVAETMCKGDAIKYVLIFKQYMYLINRRTLEILYFLLFKNSMTLTSELDFRINTLDGFTEAVLQNIDSLYADFLRSDNSSIETLVGKDKRAAIHPLFEKIMGCRKKCPFCSAPCTQSLEKHAADHRANHYPTGVSGTVDIPGWLTDTQETFDATEEPRKPRKLAIDTCQTMVGTRVDIRTKTTVQKYNKLYHRLFNWNYHSCKNYKEVAEYENWDIPYSQDHNVSLYWKWFMAQFDKELAEHYNALCPEIPEAWKKVTCEEATARLDESD